MRSPKKLFKIWICPKLVSQTLFYINFVYWGIFGLSIVNSLFVEGMINNEEDDKRFDDIIERLDRIEKNQKK